MGNSLGKWLRITMVLLLLFPLLPLEIAEAADNLTLEPGETLEISGSATISVNGGHDYVVYDQNVPVRFSMSSGGIYGTTITDNQRMVIQNNNNQAITITTTSSTVKKISQPALKKITMNAGESVEYFGGSYFKIPKDYDYAYYKEDGTAYSYSWTNESVISTLPSNVNRAVYTTVQDQIIYGPYEIFGGLVKTNTPAIKRVSMKAGESFEYFGGSDFRVPGEYDYTYYREDGSASSFGASYNSRMQDIGTNSSRVIITVKKDQVLYGAFETFKDLQKKEEPALARISVKAGESWEYFGDSNFKVPSYHNYAIYNDVTGTVVNYDQTNNVVWGKLNSGLRAIITFKNDQEVYGPYETYRQPNIHNEPALALVPVKAGESWEYFGDSNFKIPKYLDYASYDETGAVLSYEQNHNSMEYGKLNAGIRVIITFKNDQEVYGPYEKYKQPNVSQEPAIKRVSVKAGESWEYFGDSIFVVPSASDYVIYNDTGTAVNYGQSNNLTWGKLNSDLRAIITFKNNQEVYGPFEKFKNQNITDEPALYRMDINPGELLRFETPGTMFTIPGSHSYSWYTEIGQEPTLTSTTASKKYTITDKKLLIKNTRTIAQTLYGPYELFPTLRPNGLLKETYNNGLLGKMQIGNILITGHFEQDETNKQLYKATGDISFNSFLKYRGELQIDKQALTIDGNGLLYIPIKESKIMYAGQLPIYEGAFNIDVTNTNLLPAMTGKSLLSYDRLPITISSLNLHHNGVAVSGSIDFSKSLGVKGLKKVEIEQLLLTSDGIDLTGKFNLPDFNIGGLSLNNPYIDINTSENYFGGGGEVGKIGKMIVPTGGSLGGSFNFYNGRLNKLGIQSVFPRPIPIGTLPFGLSGIGGGIDNIQQINADYGTTIYVNGDLADTFSPTIDNSHLIMGDNLQFETSDLHLGTSGRLKMYNLQLGESMAEWHSKKGFSANGNMNILDAYIANYSVRVPKNKPFNGYTKGILQVPDDVWFIGGKEFSGVSGEINPNKVIVTTTFLNVDVGVVYDFENDDLKFKISDFNNNIYQTNRMSDDVTTTYGTNFRPLGSFSQLQKMSTLSINSTSTLPVPINSNEEAVLLEVKWTGNAPLLSLEKPDGGEYNLVETGEHANFMLDEAKKTAFISIKQPQMGTWNIDSTQATEGLIVDLISVKQKPRVETVNVEMENGQPVVNWDVEGAADTKVSLYVSDEKSSYTGHLLLENLPLQGSATVDLPEDLISGDHWLFIKAERSEVGTDRLYADQPISYLDPVSPARPTDAKVQSIHNGQFHLQWAPVEGADKYVIAPYNQDGQIDHSKDVLVESTETSTIIGGWETQKMYKVAVMSIDEDEAGELHYSLPSESVSFFLPAPTPPTGKLEWTPVDGKVTKKVFDENGATREIQISNSKQLRITGILDKESNTTIFVNDDDVANIQGNSIDHIINLNEGMNEVSISFVAANGDETIQTFDVMVDTVKPTLYIESPYSNEVINDRIVSVKGNSELGSIVHVNGNKVDMDAEGNFNYPLPLSKQGVKDILVTSTDMAGNVTEYTTQVISQVSIKEIKGSLIKGNSYLPDVTFSIHTINGDEKWYDVTTNELGTFTLEMSDGDYQIDGVWLEREQKWHQLNQTFTITNGELMGIDELLIPLQDEPVELPIGNIDGVVKNGSENLGGVTFSIHTTDANPTWFDIQTDVEGRFNVDLPDGEYQIDGIWLEKEQKWYVLNDLFTVKDGVITSSEQLIIDLMGNPPDQEGILGTVRKSGVGIGNLVFSLHSIDENEKWYDIKTEESGNFKVKLQDGQYQIDGVWVEDEQKWYPLNQQFSVIAGKLDGGEGLDVELQMETQKGQIDGQLTKDLIGLGNITFSAHTTDGSDIWYDLQTDDSGMFTKNLPDGEYQIDGVWLEKAKKWYQLMMVFSIVDGVLSDSPHLEITLKDDSTPQSGKFTGKVVKDTNVFANTVFSIHGIEENPTWYDLQTDRNGAFTLDLPDGEYQVDGIWSEAEKTWYTLNQLFKVKDGKLVGANEIVIDVLGIHNSPGGEITGQVVNGTAQLGEIVFSIHTTTAENVTWFDIQTDANGSFKLNLPNGNYQIDGIWVEKELKWYKLDKQFSVEMGKLKDSEGLKIDLLIE